MVTMTDRPSAATAYPARMRARIDRLVRPPSGLAALALVLGVVNIVSALTPELAERVRVVQKVLSPDAQVAARGLTLAAGVAMLLVSSSLARRKHRAWLLAVVVVSASAVLHIAKGLDSRGGARERGAAGAADPVAALVRRARRSASLRLLLAGSALLAWLVVRCCWCRRPGMDEMRILHVRCWR
jgi:lysylphosphatidylglycerol synthetase-like protein (DUF2156 family)